MFGREPRVFGELQQEGNPTGFHFDVGEPNSDVATRVRFRYHAKLEFIKSQARSMLMKTAHHCTRKITDPQIGQLVFFWRADRSKARDSQSKWVGPGYVVGRQGLGSLAVVDAFWSLGNIFGKPLVTKACMAILTSRGLLRCSVGSPKKRRLKI